MIIYENNNKTLGISSSTIEALETSQLQELIGSTIVDMPLMETMIHNRRCVSSLINGAEKSGKKQEIQGTSLAIQMMEANNHIKTGVVKPSKR